jgi:hypothetical protein
VECKENFFDTINRIETKLIYLLFYRVESEESKMEFDEKFEIDEKQ